MSTNLRPSILLGYPQIPFNAVTTAASAEDSVNTHENTITGSRANVYERGSAGTSADITYDLGTIDSTDVTDSANFAVICRADLLTGLGSDIDVAIKVSDDDFSASNNTVASISNIESDDLTGPNSQDLLLEFNQTGFWRYWRASLTSSSSYDYIFSKAFIGSWFDFGEKSPEYPYVVEDSRSGKNFTTDSGVVFRSRDGRPQLHIRITWRVTDAVAEDFREKIGKNWDHFTMVLYAPYADLRLPLGGHELVHVRLLEHPIIEAKGPRQNQNIITCRFIEEIS